MNGSKPYRPPGGIRAPSRRQRAAICGGFFPLTPALSLGERVDPSLPGGQASSLGFTLRNARCSLSPRERVRVRGNGAEYPRVGSQPELSSPMSPPL
jgi:hypothetical protein